MQGKCLLCIARRDAVRPDLVDVSDLLPLTVESRQRRLAPVAQNQTFVGQRCRIQGQLAHVHRMWWSVEAVNYLLTDVFV